MTSAPIPTDPRRLAVRLEVAEGNIEADAYQAWIRSHPHEDGLAIANGHVHVLHALRSDPVTRLWGLGLGDGPDADVIDEAIREGVRRGAVKITIEWNPYADPALLGVLGERRFIVQEFTNTYVLDLHGDVPPAKRPLSEHLRLEQLDHADPGEVDAAARVWARATFGDQAPASAIAHGRLQMSQPSRATFVVRDADQIGGVGTVGIDADVAFLCITATLPEYRSLGIQSHMLRARLDHARERGASIATIGSDPGTPSQRNIERAGFRCIYTKLIVKRPLISD